MDKPQVKQGYAAWVLIVLFLIGVLNYYDRYLLGILVEDLKRDLDLTDGQIGLLSGLAFAVVYSVAAIPIARYADRGRRVRVLGISVFFWSVATGLCGAATGFWTMLLARFGVGIGESGAMPTSHAIVAETFSLKRRATALAVLGMAGAVGTAAAFGLGGYLAKEYGWRFAFYVSVIPGIVLAIILALTVREPALPETLQKQPETSLRSGLTTLFRRKSYFWVCLGLAFASIGAFGMSAWTPAYLMRRFELDAATVGGAYSAVLGPTMLVSILIGGVFSDWLGRRDQRAPLWILAFSFGISVPATIVFLNIDDFSLALLFTIPVTIVSALWISPAYALIQNLSGPLLRALGAAVFMMVVNIVGQGFGPLFTGVVSDLLVPFAGGDSLRYALMAGTVFYVVGTILFLVAARSVQRDIAEANEVAAS